MRADEVESHRASRTRRWLPALLMILLVGAVLLLSKVGSDERSEACTLAGADGPLADSPQAAFEAWFDRDYRGSGGQYQFPAGYMWPSPDRIADRGEFDRVDQHTWEWRFTSDALVKVEVRRANHDGSGEGWSVAGANTCKLG